MLCLNLTASCICNFSFLNHLSIARVLKYLNLLSNKIIIHKDTFFNCLLFYFNFFNLSHKPPIGAKNGEDGTNFIGIGLLSQVKSSKFKSSFTMASFDCIKPNRNPMQFLDPIDNIILSKTISSNKNIITISKWQESERIANFHIFCTKSFWIELFRIGIVFWVML